MSRPETLQALFRSLHAIKGVGEGAIESILEARKDGPFKSLFDFCERVDSRKVNRKVLEALVKAGAFDFEKRPRRQIFDTIEKASNRGSSSQKDKAAVGVMEITRTWRPDGEKGEWASVAVKPVAPLKRPVTLAEMKAEPRLAKIEVLRQSRLSVTPVRDDEWAVLMEMSGGLA